MSNKFDFTLDETIDFILTDKYINYSKDEVNDIEAILKEKLQLIADKDEYEFYSGVIEGLITEMMKHRKNDTVNSGNPLKSKYDDIANNICNGVDNRMKKYIKFALSPSPNCADLKPFILKGHFNACNYYDFNSMISIISTSGLKIITGNVNNGDGQNSDDMLTAFGRTKA